MFKNLHSTLSNAATKARYRKDAFPPRQSVGVGEDNEMYTQPDLQHTAPSVSLVGTRFANYMM